MQDGLFKRARTHLKDGHRTHGNCAIDAVKFQQSMSSGCLRFGDGSSFLNSSWG